MKDSLSGSVSGGFGEVAGSGPSTMAREFKPISIDRGEAFSSGVFYTGVVAIRDF
jgi:hypothetical protein